MTPDRPSIGSIALVIGFCSLLILPVVQMSFHIVDVPLLNENRERAPRPQLREFLHPAEFTTKAQRWFQDNYGFRDFLIRLQTQVEYSIFGSSDRIHVGHDGWLYYRSVIDEEEPEVEALTDTDFDQALAKCAQLRDWLASQHIRLVVITNQMKDRFYPEFLPWTAVRARTRHRFDDFRGRMSMMPGISYIDTTPLLLELKKQRQIFHKTDFHWNDPAAFVIAGNLIDTIAALDHRPLPFWHNVLAIEQRDFSGGQAQFMPLFDPPHEQGLFVRQTWRETHLTETANQEPFEWVTHGSSGSDGLPPTVVFGDSFFDGMVRSGLADYFQSIARARIYHAPIDVVLKAMPAGTQFFVLQFIEVTLPYFRGIHIPDPNQTPASN